MNNNSNNKLYISLYDEKHSMERNSNTSINGLRFEKLQGGVVGGKGKYRLSYYASYDYGKFGALTWYDPRLKIRVVDAYIPRDNSIKGNYIARSTKNWFYFVENFGERISICKNNNVGDIINSTNAATPNFAEVRKEDSNHIFAWHDDSGQYFIKAGNLQTLETLDYPYASYYTKKHHLLISVSKDCRKFRKYNMVTGETAEVELESYGILPVPMYDKREFKVKDIEDIIGYSHWLCGTPYVIAAAYEPGKAYIYSLETMKRVSEDFTIGETFSVYRFRDFDNGAYETQYFRPKEMNIIDFNSVKFNLSSKGGVQQYIAPEVSEREAFDTIVALTHIPEKFKGMNPDEIISKCETYLSENAKKRLDQVRECIKYDMENPDRFFGGHRPFGCGPMCGRGHGFFGHRGMFMDD